jgi:hypothetical protein
MAWLLQPVGGSGVVINWCNYLMMLIGAAGYTSTPLQTWDGQTKAHRESSQMQEHL